MSEGTTAATLRLLREEWEAPLRVQLEAMTTERNMWRGACKKAQAEALTEMEQKLWGTEQALEGTCRNYEAAQVETAAMRRALDAELRRCPNCRGEGRVSLGMSVTNPQEILWQECLTCKPIRLALSGTVGQAMLDRLAAQETVTEAAVKAYHIWHEAADPDRPGAIWFSRDEGDGLVCKVCLGESAVGHVNDCPIPHEGEACRILGVALQAAGYLKGGSE